MQLEGEATARAIRLAAFVNTPLYVVHVMSIDAMEEIAKARKSGFMFFYLFSFFFCESPLYVIHVMSNSFGKVCAEIT